MSNERRHTDRYSTHQRQPPPDGTGLLLAKVKGKVLLVLVELPQVLALLRVRDGKYPSDRLPDGVAGLVKGQQQNIG